ncbi:bifunctional nicotinamidase/pyrazinamidase [Vibrio viridaestus]|uniref:Nicotinamidase n=1 Tax=Vibrio viridaestus TaxID=2487322 RepID=A0A3N9TGU1_9VIBR|nr:bifunctional nicotinamidase/pyrazinamidase [Vibrio viridaestus]RQW63501.1 bifunctional nicotinamidase/pyrazinamidase [Vibrio viridaestus]
MKTALLLVDIQNDFSPSGALPVPQGDKIVPVVNKLLDRFDLVVAMLDWHPENHGSFVTQHKGKEPGELVELAGIPQIVWPVHCVQESDGAKFIESLQTNKIDHVVHKGTHVDVDSYSGFFDNQKINDTGLAEHLRSQGIDKVYVTGLATDYCVKFTALDAVELGFETYVITDATKGVNMSPGDVEAALQVMAGAGCTLVTSQQLME